MLSPWLHPALCRTSSLLRLSLPPISQPHPRCPLPLAILRSDIEFTCSSKQPEYSSCQLNPGCHVPSSQVSGTLGHGYKRNYPFSTSSFALTRLLHWFTFVQLVVFAPTEILISVFPLSLTTCKFPHHAAQGGLITTPEGRH
jgi:hypothetical protein